MPFRGTAVRELQMTGRKHTVGILGFFVFKFQVYVGFFLVNYISSFGWKMYENSINMHKCGNPCLRFL